jgi:hypothetical protein
MCSVGSGSNNSIAATSPNATGAGGQSVGGSWLAGSTRVARGGARGSILAGGSGSPGSSGGGSTGGSTGGGGGGGGKGHTPYKQQQYK